MKQIQKIKNKIIINKIQKVYGMHHNIEPLTKMDHTIYCKYSFSCVNIFPNPKNLLVILLFHLSSNRMPNVSILIRGYQINPLPITWYSNLPRLVFDI